MGKQAKPKRLQKLRHKYRLVILNDETFEEKISLKLSRLNVFVVFAASSILLVALTILVIAFTPLREYIPGYASTELKRKTIEMSLKADSLETQLAYNKKYLDNIRGILRGEPVDPVVQSDESRSLDALDIQLTQSKEDSLLRQMVEEEDRFNLPAQNRTTLATKTMFAPLKGVISQEFDPANEHFGIDIAAASNSPVKACLEGTVLLAEWTAETGYVIIIQHKGNLISTYKHNASLLKKPGDFVRTGEAIAIMGSTGTHTTGPHLHFELWQNGIAVNPKDYISF